jgi:hypothetical protein
LRKGNGLLLPCPSAATEASASASYGGGTGETASREAPPAKVPSDSLQGSCNSVSFYFWQLTDLSHLLLGSLQTTLRKISISFWTPRLPRDPSAPIKAHELEQLSQTPGARAENCRGPPGSQGGGESSRALCACSKLAFARTKSSTDAFRSSSGPGGCH